MAPLILIVFGVFCVVHGIWQLTVQTPRLERAEVAVVADIPAYLRELEQQKEWSIYRWAYNGKTQVRIKVDRSTYRGEVGGEGSSLAEAVAAAMQELHR